MQCSVSNKNISDIKIDCLVIAVHHKYTLDKIVDQMSIATRRHLESVLRKGDLGSTPGSTTLVYGVPELKASRVLLFRLGVVGDLTSERYHMALNKLFSQTAVLNCQNVLFPICNTFVANRTDAQEKTDSSMWQVRQVALAFSKSEYHFLHYKSDTTSKKAKNATLVLHTTQQDNLQRYRDVLCEAEAMAAGVSFARDLGNHPPNICTPKYLASQALALAKKYPHIAVEILKTKDLQKKKMNALLAVAQGSTEEPRLIKMSYQGKQSKKGDKPIILVGKGVTFDTGGISLKPPANMDEMKFDMCGAASVFGVLKAVSMLDLPLKVIGLIPAVENMPSGNAARPGDIVRTMSGQTVEILNTDAEGRLILSDALHYACEHNPDVVIDIATLTGACVIALGSHASGLMSNHQPLAEQLLSAGRIVHDRAWQLPLWDDYQQQLDSPFADMANIGGREAGTITAGCFLSRYTKDVNWAHIDIAGTAWRGGQIRNATGRPVPLLVQYLLDRAKK